MCTKGVEDVVMPNAPNDDDNKKHQGDSLEYDDAVVTPWSFSPYNTKSWLLKELTLKMK